MQDLVGIEVRESSALAVCIDKNGVIGDSLEVRITKGEERLPQIGRTIIEASERFGEFSTLGIAVPGLLNVGEGRVVYSTHIPEHEELNFVDDLKHYTEAQIAIENDANAAAYAEFQLGAGRGAENLFYATLGAGVGGALILDSKLWRGSTGYAGEFGYISINSEGMKLEEVASSANIIRRTKSWFHQDPTSSLNAIGEENITVRDVVREAGNEDNFAQLMLQRTGTYVGTAIASVINLLNVERVIVGGEIMHAKHLVLDAIIQRAKELSFVPSFKSVEILEGALGDNASAIGAALLASEGNGGDHSAETG